MKKLWRKKRYSLLIWQGMKKKKWWFRFWSNNIFLVPLYLLLQWCCLINSHCFSKMWCFFKLWWKFQYLNCLTVNLKIYLGLFCPWQNGECCDPGSDYLWFQNRIIILHTFTRGKKLIVGLHIWLNTLWFFHVLGFFPIVIECMFWRMETNQYPWQVSCDFPQTH